MICRQTAHRSSSRAPLVPRVPPVRASLFGRSLGVQNLGVDGNAALESLAGLDGLKSLDMLWVQFNPLLPSEQASALTATFNAAGAICNNAGPPEDCVCSDWLD